MNEVQKILDIAFNLISTIPVSGDNVEIMADIKNYLRTAYTKVGEAYENAKKAPPEEPAEEAENG